ncbi:hypothetical protein CWE21_08650 [Pseudidiomarina aquimaris]|uniref:DUF945 domain-containing protein n=1 Tax=Pseudidiomarina aquimaris TaxID=641841 RepID=A0A432XEU0_9GAMM|nr:DUF945 family protein [Pseudidiomarina aquimaris]RUO47253.1 hypothetical protein CWE21_08650 [Pseudidiomarina aquimaris]
MSKKGWGIGVAVVVAGLVISPTLIGSQAESSIREHVALFDQEQPAYSLEVVSYERGWFSANAVLKMSVDLATLMVDPDAEEVSTLIDVSIQHGPILTDQGFGLGLAAWQATNDGAGLETYVQWDTEQPFYLQQGTVNLLGIGVFQDYIPAIQSTSALPDFSFSMTEFRGDGHYSNGEFSYQGNHEQLQLNVADEFSVDVNAMAINFDATADLKTMLRGVYYPSAVTFTLGQMRMAAAEEELFLMSHLVSDIAMLESEDGSLVHVHMGYKADNLYVDGTEVSDVRMLTQVNNIDRGFIDDYFSSMKDLVGEDDPQVLATRMTAMMERHKADLLTAQPELAFPDFGFSMTEGSLDGSMLMTLAQIDQLPAQVDDAFIQQNLIANADLKIDKALAHKLASAYVRTAFAAGGPVDMDPEQLNELAEQQATTMLQNFVQQGMLTSEEEHYLFHAEVAQGMLNLNGQQLPLGQMM